MSSWDKLQFLLGDWSSPVSGQPGQGVSGSTTFSFDLDQKIMIRRSSAEFAPEHGQTKSLVHDDLLVIYQQPEESQFRAIYFDNEDHIIRYNVTMFGDKVIFTSEQVRGAPRYRFTYTRASSDALRIKFEIAPPGKDFATYIEAGARKTPIRTESNSK